MSTLPLKGEPYMFELPLCDMFDSSRFVIDPTIVEGDFKVKPHAGSFVNLTNLPVVFPAGSSNVQVSLTGAEMDTDKVVVQAIDQSDDEWQAVNISLDVPTSTIETVAETATAILDLEEGDHDETNVRAQVFKRGTTEIILDKDIAGSLLSPSVRITTREHDE